MNTPKTGTSSAAQYVDKLRIVAGSGVGVIATPTREPFRCLSAIQEYAFASNRKCWLWDWVNGWTKFNKDSPDRPEVQAAPDPVQAIALIADRVTASPGPGFYVMMHPHKALTVPKFLQYIKQAVFDFSEDRRRLILLIPDEVELPAEIKDDVVLIDFEPPSVAEHREAYEWVMGNACTSGGAQVAPPYNEAQIDEIVTSGRGLTDAEFTNAISQAISANESIFPDIPVEQFLRNMSEAKVEMVRRSNALEILTPVNPDQIGGLHAVKEWMAIQRECFSEEAREFGADRPKGCAAFGPPGTGKSLLFKAAAYILQIPLIRFDISQLFTKYVGDTEGRVRSTLKLLESMAPCVAFIDEIDKAGLSPTGGGDSGVGTRVLGSILNFMQESTASIFWGFSGNRVAGIPSELLRKGRLDEIWSVTLPNDEERRAIIQIHVAKRKQDFTSLTDVDALVARSSGYVGAEIEAAVSEAVKLCFVNNVPLTGKLISEQLGRPLSESFRADFASMQEWAENNAKPASHYRKSSKAEGPRGPSGRTRARRLVDGGNS